MAQSDGLLCTTYYDVLLRIPIKMGKAQMHISIPDHYRIDVATEHPDFNILSLIFVTLDPLPGTKCEACRFCGCARLFFFFVLPHRLRRESHPVGRGSVQYPVKTEESSEARRFSTGMLYVQYVFGDGFRPPLRVLHSISRHGSANRLHGCGCLFVFPPSTE